VIGEPGAGKSAALHQLAGELVSRHDRPKPGHPPPGLRARA
jgi:hypothetical protein